MDNIEKM